MFPLAEAAVAGGLQLITRCGKEICRPYEYCSLHSSTCESCSAPCSQTGNNFDEEICVSSCQDYIHDKIKRYSTDDIHKATHDLQDTIENLRTLTAVSLSLSVFLFLVMALVGGFLWLRHRRLVKKEQDLMDQKMSVNKILFNPCCGTWMLTEPNQFLLLIRSKSANSLNVEKEELKDEKMPTYNKPKGHLTIANNNICNDLGTKLPSSASNTAAPSVITDITRLSSRRPEEDSTLEYAYDNQGMVPSPIVRDPRDETMF